MTASVRRMIRAAAKTAADACALALVAPAAATAWLERKLSPHGESVFGLWAQVLALVPGVPGVVVRRAYYRLTLDECQGDFYIGFGTIFTHRHAQIADGVYVGAYALVGCAVLGRGCLIGSRASLLSGGGLHELLADGTWSATDPNRRRQIAIGEHAWIGEGATVLANVGPQTMVAAGAVVSVAVPARIMVAGNPARFVKVIEPRPARPEVDAEGTYVEGIPAVD
jgi:acetyltransferase-like isoleucine patch superfamily enzyme